MNGTNDPQTSTDSSAHEDVVPAFVIFLSAIVAGLSADIEPDHEARTDFSFRCPSFPELSRECQSLGKHVYGTAERRQRERGVQLANLVSV